MTETIYSLSWKTWCQSENGHGCLDIHTLESSRSQDDFEKYLTNRLKTAFEAGWNAAAETASEVVTTHRLEHDFEEVH